MADRFILSHIQRLPMFARCTDDQLAAFADAFQERTYHAGETLYRQGEDSHAMMVFVSGGGQLYRDNQPQGVIAPGQYVGEPSLFNHAARDATVIATADSVILILTRDSLLATIATHPDLRTALNEPAEWINSLPGTPLRAAPQTSYPNNPASTAPAANYQQAYPQQPQYPANNPQVPQYPAVQYPNNQYSAPQYPAPQYPAPQYPAQNVPPAAPARNTRVNNFSQEQIILHTRRHLWTVGGKTVGALAVIAVSLSAIVLVIQSAAVVRNVIDGVAGLIIMVAGLMIAYWMLEWFGDTFTVTTMRIVHNIRVFPSGAETHEQTLLSSVQNVDITRSGLLSDVLGFGDLIITVAGSRQPMVLDHIPHPELAQRTIVDQVERVSADPLLSSAGGTISPPMVNGIPRYSAPIRTGGRFLPHTREVIGDRIIYRKHWGVLIGYEIKPAIAYILWFAFAIARGSATGQSATLLAQTASILNIFSAAWFILTTFWVVWEYLRWYDDIYILDSETVVDIVRQPFGLREVRIQAGLPQIQNVTSETHSLWGTLFNFGDVLIQTAAQQGQMVFVGVHNPTGVADEVLQRVRAYTANRYAQEQTMNRDAFAQALSGYQGNLPGGGQAYPNPNYPNQPQPQQPNPNYPAQQGYPTGQQQNNPPHYPQVPQNPIDRNIRR